MKFSPLLPGRFVERRNRFLALVEVDGEGTFPTFIPNSGRMEELLVTGARVFLKDRRRLPGKTHYELVLVEKGGVLVGVDSRLPPRILEEAIWEGRTFQGYKPLCREPSLGGGRADLLLEGGRGEPVWVETKSVNLVKEGLALFPDAPTTRGARHLQNLQALVRGGKEAHVVFVVQRPDVMAFAPFDERDPDFAQVLRGARDAGVGVSAFRCEVSLEEIVLAREIPVIL